MWWLCRLPQSLFRASRCCQGPDGSRGHSVIQGSDCPQYLCKRRLNLSSNKGLVLLQKSVFHHEAALFVRQLFLLLKQSLHFLRAPRNKSQHMHHYSDSPHPHRNPGHWWSDLRRKGDDLPLWSAGEPVPARGWT